MKKLVIDREKWYRGKGFMGSALRVEDTETYCCLGFLGKSCGLLDQHITGIGSPGGLQSKYREEFPPELFTEGEDPSSLVGNSAWTSRAIALNDDEHLAEPDREAALTYHFHQIGYELEFIN